MGGETEKTGSGNLAADDRVILLGIEAEKWGAFLFRLGFSETVTETEGAATFFAVLVLFLSGGSTFCCFFLLSRLMGILSSDSSVEMLSIGVDGVL